MDEPIYFAEPFTRAQAWIDLLLLANYADGFFYVRGNKVTVKPGQIARSQQSLAERWQWGRGKVNRFLTDLEDGGKIIQQKSRLINLISITNFEKFDCIEQQTVQQIEQQTDINKKNKKNKNNNNSSYEECIVEKKPKNRFIPPTIEEVKSYISENGLKVDAQRFIDFYESKGWLVGKVKMKDWKAAIRGWSTRQIQEYPRRNNVQPSKNANDEWL